MADERETFLGQVTGGEPSVVRAFHLEGAGLQRILGPLESDILEAVWRLTPDGDGEEPRWTTIGAVCDALGAGHHYKTVQTVMNRMAAKRLLARRHRLRAHEYRALVTRAGLISDVSQSVIQGLMHDFGDLALAQLVKALRAITPDQLALLERLASDDVEQRAAITSASGRQVVRQANEEQETP